MSSRGRSGHQHHSGHGQPVEHRRAGAAAAAADGIVVAAGALCWRPAHPSAPTRTQPTQPLGPAGIEVLLVRSARWGDWSWPKGKIEPGETLPECAVREVTEETGVRPVLGVPLPALGYVLPDGRDKIVHLWAAKSDPADPSGSTEPGEARTAGPEEIAEVAWLPVPAAIERLSRPGDLAPLEALLTRARLGTLDTRALLVVRHAKARSRAHWDGEEADRPLTPVGRVQADRLAGLLACWAPQRLLSSPWARCRETLRPYQVDPEILPPLSEQALRDDPDNVRRTLEELLAQPRSALVCTHRPVLEPVFATLGAHADAITADHLPSADPWLAPAEVLIAQINDEPGDDRQQRAVARVRTVEQFRAEPLQNVLA